MSKIHLDQQIKGLFNVNSILFCFNMVRIKNPGTIVKNKNGIISLNRGRSSNIIRSVTNNIAIVMIDHSLACKFLILFNITNNSPIISN